jgi:hypothetical protein
MENDDITPEKWINLTEQNHMGDWNTGIAGVMLSRAVRELYYDMLLFGECTVRIDDKGIRRDMKNKSELKKVLKQIGL